ncbi:MAG: NAD(P)/FAD-dependent oxidoreductase [Candidatus Micrarchaeaceae archaeon]|jgi:digeranylgeranylglycerophospholipid reductase
MNRKVFVVGAGVVGLTLAKELAMHNIDVEVFDSKKAVSDGAAKASGIFSTTGLSRIGINFDEGIVNTLDGAVLHAGKETLNIKSKKTMAYIVDRGILAEICKKEAIGAGATVTLGKKLGKQELHELASNRNNVVVGADGAVSTVASAFSFPEIKEYILTYKAEYSKADIEDKNVVGLFFSNEIAYRFFGWSCPYSRDKIEIGIGISDRAKTNSVAAFNKFVHSGWLGETLKTATKMNGYASIIPLSSRKTTVKNNVMLVGDAAGQVKATTGGGIIFGCSCAKILAKNIKNNFEKETPLTIYEKEWRKKYSLDLKMHHLLHNYYSNLRVNNFEVFLKISKVLGAEKFFSEYGDMDRPSLMLKRFFLRGLAK